MNFGVYLRGGHWKRCFMPFVVLPLTFDIFESTRQASRWIASRFNRELIHEAITLFDVIIITIVVALTILKGNESYLLVPLLQHVTSADVLHNEAVYFWMSGIFPGFLRNVSTYMNVLNSAGGDFSATQGILAITLLAISARIVFICVRVHIKDDLNFIVKSITERRGIPMYGLLGTVGWSILFSILLFGLVIYRCLCD